MESKDKDNQDNVISLDAQRRRKKVTKQKWSEASRRKPSLQQHPKKTDAKAGWLSYLQLFAFLIVLLLMYRSCSG